VLPCAASRSGDEAPKTVGALLLSARAACRTSPTAVPGIADGTPFEEEEGVPVPSPASGGGAGRDHGVPGTPPAPQRGVRTDSHVTAREPGARDGGYGADVIPSGARGSADEAGTPGETGRAGGRAWDDEEPDGRSAGGERKRRVDALKGLLVHKVLESVREPPSDERSVESLLGRAVSRLGTRYTRVERESAARQAELSLRRVFSDGRMAVYFSKGAAREVVFVSGGYGRGMGRIDRAVFGEEIRVVDFKTNECGGTGRLRELVSLYRGQVKAYCQALERIFPEKTVTGALYFTEAPYEERLVSVYEAGRFSTLP
jgi:PD-(D/E)XK nuclease superfamily